MSFEPLEAAFSSVERLGCRDVLWGERLILDLFEYLESGDAQEVEVGGEKLEGVQTIGLTKASRIWRLTFERALAVRVRDESLRFFQPKPEEESPLPAACCFTYQSAWLSELFPDPTFNQHLGELAPTHYIFNLLDDLVEIVADDSPTIEEIENELA
jgi:hypothetical protein